ncbi:alpha-ribazole phosphatase [Arcicella aurantiaca]|uniref:Alpha-ribazole phosphatase n=1 Tax=Arcicella aurantiaca TaxID=591202 RepID=A0A316DGH3_9BACT|nr:alpha-ribazole phosphatase [Arcicella aurantiaca]PWK17301.1 alpha-ribazole phosphatase [Arcicella aurantiaca]
MEIYIIRHTEIKNISSICYGQSNPPLADTFLEEVATIKAKLPTDFDSVYSSPLIRCQLLANELGFQNIQFDDSLMELNFGIWEGKPWNEIPSLELNPWMIDFVNVAPPEGESLIDMQARVSSFIEALRTQPHKKVIIITHAGVIRCIFSHILNIPLINIFKLSVEYGEVFCIKLAKESVMDKVFLKNL